jgi:hypothetical protein
MPKALVDALVPIFAGLLLGFWAGRRGLIDNVNVRDLVALGNEHRGTELIATYGVAVVTLPYGFSSCPDSCKPLC